MGGRKWVGGWVHRWIDRWIDRWMMVGGWWVDG